MLSSTFPSISTESLHCWRVMEAVWPRNIRTRHVCGQNAGSNKGISTSSIQEFDPVAMTVKTRSRKTYLLVGLPDNSSLGESAWRKWCKNNGIVAVVDVTSDYLNADPVPAITFRRLKRLGVPATC